MPATPRRDAPSVPTGECGRCGACAECGTALRNAAVCDACGALNRSAAAPDPFALLGLAKAFDMDPAALNSTYRAIARRIHPDRFTNSDDPTRALAARLSAEINHAQQILADPVQRANYLLVQAGGPTAADLREVSDDLLVETMTLREGIEDARSQRDVEALASIRDDVTGRKNAALQRIARSASKLPACDDAEKTELRKQLNAMKYYDNLLAGTMDDSPRM